MAALWTSGWDKEVDRTSVHKEITSENPTGLQWFRSEVTNPNLPQPSLPFLLPAAVALHRLPTARGKILHVAAWSAPITNHTQGLICVVVHAGRMRPTGRLTCFKQHLNTRAFTASPEYHHQSASYEQQSMRLKPARV